MISPTQIIIILIIVILLFGTKKLRGLGSDLGTAIKGFKKSVADDDSEQSNADAKDKEAETDNDTKEISNDDKK